MNPAVHFDRIADAQTGVTPTERQRAHNGGQAPMRILIADDQPEHLEMIARAILTHPHGARLEVVRAKDGRAALAAIRQGIDVAFLDIRMPIASGLEVLEAVRGDPEHVHLPVAIVSSSIEPRDVECARRLGVVAYIEKGRFRPFLVRVQEVLDVVLKGNRLSAPESAAPAREETVD